MYLIDRLKETKIINLMKTKNISKLNIKYKVYYINFLLFKLFISVSNCGNLHIYIIGFNKALCIYSLSTFNKFFITIEN